MIVVDASVFIAFLDGCDHHKGRAERLFVLLLPLSAARATSSLHWTTFGPIRAHVNGFGRIASIRGLSELQNTLCG